MGLSDDYSISAVNSNKLWGDMSITTESTKLDFEQFAICGFRRSGTTLMLAVLCSDPRANAPAAESQTLTRIVEAYQWAESNFDDFGRPYFESRLEQRRLFSDACARFMLAAYRRTSSNGILVLKHPALMNVLPAFRAVSPATNVVMMVRDPRDQIASELALRSNGTRDVKAHAETLASWYDRGLPYEGVHIVRYEDLVSDPESEKTKLEKRFSLTLRFQADKHWPDISGLHGFRDKPSWSEKYGQPIDTASVGRFRADLSEPEVQTVEEICVDLMEAHGYGRHRGD